MVNRILIGLSFCWMLCAAFAGCGQMPTVGVPEDLTDEAIVLEGADGYQQTLTVNEIYYRFFADVNNGILAFDWASPSEILPEYFLTFFVNRTRWLHTDAESIVLPQEAVEQYLGRYFDVQPEYLRQAMYYLPEQQGYELPMMGGGTAITHITKVETDSHFLIIFYDRFWYSPDAQAYDVLKQGRLTIEIESLPLSYRYISNEITYDADAEAAAVEQHMEKADLTSRTADSLEQYDEILRPLVQTGWIDDSFSLQNPPSADRFEWYIFLDSTLGIEPGFAGPTGYPHYEQDIVEEMMEQYFGIPAEKLRKIDAYHAELDGYAVPEGIGSNMFYAEITNVEQDGDMLTIYSTIEWPENEDYGTAVTQTEWNGKHWKYISNRFTAFMPGKNSCGKAWRENL